MLIFLGLVVEVFCLASMLASQNQLTPPNVCERRARANYLVHAYSFMPRLFSIGRKALDQVLYHGLQNGTRSGREAGQTKGGQSGGIQAFPSPWFGAKATHGPRTCLKITRESLGITRKSILPWVERMPVARNQPVRISGTLLRNPLTRLAIGI